MKTNITILLFFFLSQVFAQTDLNYPSLKAQQYAEAAEAAYAQDNLKEAEKYARFTLRELRAVGAGDSPIAVLWREKHAEVLYVTGNAQQAISLLQENAAGIEEHFGKLSEQYIYNRENIAEALTLTSTNYIEALPYREEAFAIAEQLYAEGEPGFIKTLYNLASAYRGAEYLDKALEIFPRLLEIEEKYIGKEHFKYGHDLLQWGTVYAIRMDWTEAIPKLKEGWRIFSKTMGADHPMSIVVYKHLIDAHLSTGDYEKALYYSRLNEQFYFENEGNTLPYLGYTYMVMGDIFKLQEQLDTARLYYLKSKDFIVEHLGKEHRTYQTILGVMARFNRENGHYDAAIEQYKQQIQWFAENPGKQVFTESMPEEGLLSCYYLTSKYEKALALYPRVLEKTKYLYGENSVSVAEIYMLGAFLYRALGRDTDSHAAYFKWTDTYHNFVQHIFLYLPEDRQRMLFERTIFLRDLLLSFAMQEEGQEFVSAGLDFALRYKNLILQSKIDRKKIAQRAGAGVVDLLARQQSAGAALAEYYSQATGTQTEDFLALKASHEQLSEELAQISADLLASQNTSWQSLQKELKKDEAVIETVRFQYINENKQLTDSTLYLAYVLKADSPPIRVFLFEEKETGSLSATRSRYAATTDKPSWRKLLSAKLIPHLDNIKKLHYAPTGLLHRVNLGAVPIDESSVFAERFDLQLLNASNQLNKKQKAIKAPKSAVLYGGIDYELRRSISDADSTAHRRKISELGDDFRNWRDKGWEYLDWSAKEVQEIGLLLRSKKIETQILTGADATEETFKNLGRDAPSPQILHLATHGFFFPNPKEEAKTGFRNSPHPLIRSGLILAGANATWKGGKTIDGKEDGILTAYEIAQMDLSNTNLVVLSACDTALGDIEDNEGVYGLQRAFKAAGARYILMSLWSVNDKKTYEFMTRFYDLYQNEGKSIPEAYQLTQNELRVKYALPFNPRGWAGFVLVE